MRISIIALGSRGDVQPLINLARGLQAAGHFVRLASFETFGPLARDAGLAFLPIAGDPQALVNMAGAGMLSLVRQFGSLARSYARDLSNPILGEADLMISQLPLALYASDLAERYRLPLLQAAVIPLLPTQTFPMMGLPNLPLPGFNRSSYAVAMQIIWLTYRPVINTWRRQVLGLPPAPVWNRAGRMGTPAFPVVNGFSPAFVPRPPDWPAGAHITGYWFPGQREWQPPEKLRRFLDGGSRPIFIGFGSMPVRDPRRMTRKIVEGVRRSGRRAILHTGWGGIGQGDLPKSMFKIDEVPYEWLFPRMEMIVHHGGSGTTAHAVQAGVPSLVIPFIFDQHFWGRRTAELGVALPPIRLRRLTAGKLARAMHEALDQRPGLQRRAAELGARIRAERGVVKAVQLIETFMSQRVGR